ncbi:MAG: hypothetical protein KIT39_21070 [Nitrospirales bacterium]|nr:hypothetical protein [Nitrospirales bacterium]
MAGKPRLHVAGDVYHVVVRRNVEQYASMFRRHIGMIDGVEIGEGAITRLRQYISTLTQA